MSASAKYTSSIGLRTDQAKWEFALPGGARRLIASGDFDGRDNDTLIVKWLASDRALRERLLRWCNVSEPCQTLEEAARVIDRSELTRLAVLAFARGLFQPGQMVDGIRRDRLWGHSIAVGTVASMISRTCGHGDPSLVFVAGSLHDIGLCANQRLTPDSYREISNEVDELSPTHEIEQVLQRLGINSGMLAVIWWQMGDSLESASRLYWEEGALMHWSGCTDALIWVH